MPAERFRVMLQMRIHPGQADDFVAEWRSGTEAVTGHPANLGQWLARSSSEADTYYIVSEWVDETGFRAFENSGAHLRHRERLHAFRSSATFATMQVVEYIEGAAAHAR
ncbi:antibiotic biosynthesis monooxygenase family protein [Streptacidiphilus sp. PAMC 29251]